MKAATLLLATAALTATSAAPAAPRNAAYARLGETVRVGGLRVTPLRVVEDSRCPENARCIRAGTVRLAVRIDRLTRTLTLGESTEVRDGTLQLAAVLPERKTTAMRPAPRDYRFAFRFDSDRTFRLIRD